MHTQYITGSRASTIGWLYSDLAHLTAQAAALASETDDMLRRVDLVLDMIALDDDPKYAAWVDAWERREIALYAEAYNETGQLRPAPSGQSSGMRSRTAQPNARAIR